MRALSWTCSASPRRQNDERRPRGRLCRIEKRGRIEDSYRLRGAGPGRRGESLQCSRIAVVDVVEIFDDAVLVRPGGEIGHVDGDLGRHLGADIHALSDTLADVQIGRTPGWERVW